MQITTAARWPGAFTPGWHLQHDRPNDYGYRAIPIERGRPADVAEELSDDIQGRLLDIDVTSIESTQLAELAGTLYWDGYISRDAFEELAIYSFDHKGVLNLSSWIESSRVKLRRPDFAEYTVAIRAYEATIDAVEGIGGLVDYLKGRLVDSEA